MMQGNQPILIGNDMAIELSVDARTGRRRSLNNIPVIQVLCSVLPGAVDSPMIIFKECLQRSYSYALAVAKRQGHETDTVYVTITHEGIEKNGGNWGSMSYPINIALESIVEAWDQAMQSGTPIDLSQGALQMVCTYTLGHDGPLPTEPAMMGREDSQVDSADEDFNSDNEDFIDRMVTKFFSIKDDGFLYTDFRVDGGRYQYRSGDFNSKLFR